MLSGKKNVDTPGVKKSHKPTSSWLLPHHNRVSIIYFAVKSTLLSKKVTHYWRASTSSGFGSNSPIELNKWISNHTFITVFTTRPQYTSAIAIMFGKLRVITSSRVIIKLLLLLPINITDYIHAITVVIRLPYHTHPLMMIGPLLLKITWNSQVGGS